MPTIGYASIQIIPSVRGISDELRRQLVGPAGGAGGDAGRAAGSGLKDKLKVGAAAAGAAAGALLVAGIGEAMEQANITGTLQAQLGTTGKVAASQGKIAGKLYSSGVSGSFQEAADAIKSVVQAGLAPPGTTNAQLQQMATKASDVANVFGQDLGGVTNAVSQLMRTGLAKNSTEAFDLITRGFQSGADKGGDLLDTVNEYGTQFRKAGLTGADAMGLISQAIKAGARDSDVAADAIKEFSIRAVDGSKTSADGFKALGLNADDMAGKFAKGGKSANGVLDLTLDRLRNVKDPVKQSQIAVQLFGTQAEDLGKALYAMDPSSAADGLGKVGGAAKRVGDTIRSGPSHEIEVFTRTLKQGFVDFIGGQVLPVVSGVAHALNTVLGPAVSGIGGVVSGTVGWFRDWGIWLTPLAIAIGGVTLALNAQAIATGIVTAVFSVYRAAILVGTAVTSGFAAAQAVLNAVMALNPFVLIAIAVVALGAALVIAWKKSETFKNIVMAAWQGIQTAAMWAWNSVLKPTFAALTVAFQAVASAAMWLWTNAIQPVVGFIVAAFKFWWTAVKVYFTAVGVLFYTLGQVAMWLWRSAISPVIGWIIAGFKLWWAGVKLYFNLVMAGLRTVGSWFKWLWNAAIKPVFGWIVAGAKLWWSGVKLYFNAVMTGLRTVGSWFKWLWTAAVRPAWNGIVAAGRLAWSGVKTVFGWLTGGLKTIAGWFRWLWNNGVKPAFSGIRSTISTVYNTGIKPVFNALKSAVGLVGKAFGSAKNAIKIAWDKVKGIAKAPVDFVVNTVYNKGIVGVWNKVAGAFGAPKLGKFSFARGGVLPGYTPGRDPHKFFSPTGGMLEMSGGESIMRPEFTRAVGGGFVSYFNRIAKTRGANGVKAALAPTLGGNPQTPTQRFADGGIFGWIGKTASGIGSSAWETIKKGASWLKDGVESSMRAGVKAVVDPLLKNFPGADTGFGKMIRRIPKKILDAVFGYSKTADKKGAGGIGGPRVQAALSWARGQAGKAYQWGGNGNPSWDCSGLVSAIESVLRGQRPHRRWSTHAFSGATAPPGWAQNATSPFRIGITNAGVGHTAGTLGGVNVESRGGDGVVVGKRARGYSSSLFTSRYGFTPAKKYDQGGWLQPGITTVVNKTGRPEAVLTAGQFDAVHRAARGGDGASISYTINARTADFTVADLDRVQRIQEARARVGRPR